MNTRLLLSVLALSVVSPAFGQKNPFAGERLYVNPDTDAAKAVRSEQDPAKKKLMAKVAAGAECAWFGDWIRNPEREVGDYVRKVEAAKCLPVIVLYNIPLRDQGEYSAGGAKNPDGYKAWIDRVAIGIGKSKVIVILEPDALAQLDRLKEEQKKDRIALIRYTVEKLKVNPKAAVYLDAGHPAWHSPAIMVERLGSAGVDKADGFALNVSNFQLDEKCIEYGVKISDQIGKKHFVVDRGRNGKGPDPKGEWCNPPGRGLGKLPTVTTGNARVDGYLWVKPPYASDGDKNGAPKAGEFHPAYALELAKNANW